MISFASPSLFFSKNDSQDPRLGDLSKSRLYTDIASASEEFALVGYPDDEGISLNGGRAGAKLAPDQIRTSFYKMTPSVFSQRTFGVADLGNISNTLSLNERHQAAKTVAKTVFQSTKRLLTLGGGHDYGYPDGSAFIESMSAHKQKQKPIIFNFDAHLDVRHFDGLAHSGTPFYRLLSEFPGQFDLVEVGIQAQCNSRNHLRWAEDQGAQIVSLEEIQHKGLVEALTPWLTPSKSSTSENLRPCFLSVDIDGFQSSEAPGCSQSWTTGIKTIEFLDLMTKLPPSYDLRGMGIYEVSPPLDFDNRTSKLAALLLHHFIHLF